MILILWAAILLGAQDSPALPKSHEYDAILLVGGKPDGVEVPSLDMVLRARKACNLMHEDKAYTLLVSGNEFNNTVSKITVTERREWIDRAKEERIRSGDMLVIIAFARGIGRLAIKLRPDPKDIAPLCQQKNFKKILCVGDGNGPEKPAVDTLKAQGAEVTFVPPYTDLEQARKDLAGDCVLTDKDLAGIKAQFSKLDPTFGVEWNLEQNDIALIKGGGGTMAGDGPTGLLGAVKLFKAGYAKYIFPTGGSRGYTNDGEVAAILCEGFGVPADRVIYGPSIGSSSNLRSGEAWGKANGCKRAIICGSWGASSGMKPRAPGEFQFRVWGLGRGEFKAILPRDKDRKNKEIAAELEAEVAKWEQLEKAGTEEEKAEAKARLPVIGRGNYGQLAGLMERLDIGFTDGRMTCFPSTPWDYDGISSFPMWLEDESPNAALRGVVGSSAVRVWNKQLKGEDQVKYMVHDYGSRGPWQDYLDATIKVVPDRWVKYPPPFRK